MNTVTALDTFLFIDQTEPVLIIGDRLHRTGFLTGSFQMHDGTIRTTLGTHAAFLAEIRCNMHL